MKKLNVYATIMNINGRKSSGCEDFSGFQNWKAQSGWAEAGGSWHPAQD